MWHQEKQYKPVFERVLLLLPGRGAEGRLAAAQKNYGTGAQSQTHMLEVSRKKNFLFLDLPSPGRQGRQTTGRQQR